MRYIIILILLWIPGIVQAQSNPYKLLVKGERSPYDSAVAIEIHQYRFETRASKLADSLVLSLSKENAALRRERVHSDELMANYRAENDKLIMINQRKDQVIKDAVDKFDKIYREAIKYHWYEDPKILIPAAFITGFLIAK